MISKPDRSEQVLRGIDEVRLVNGSAGDPLLFVDYPGRNDALLFDSGENGTLDSRRLGDIGAVLLSHHHMDHFVGFDRVVRANLDRDKTLHVFGPEGTIRKVYRRIKSYDYPFFPFQKLVLSVHDVLDGRLRSASLDCARHFPRPVIHEEDRSGPAIYENQDVVVETELVRHTTPCLAFAMVEKTGKPPDRAGRRIAYVTDTVWNEETRPGLVRLAAGSARLYCDSCYAHEQLAQAQKHRHMTATQAAELAREAGVGELVLIHLSSRYQGRYEPIVAEARAIFPRTFAEFAPSTQE